MILRFKILVGKNEKNVKFYQNQVLVCGVFKIFVRAKVQGSLLACKQMTLILQR
jgi:hypothetical protein